MTFSKYFILEGRLNE